MNTIEATQVSTKAPNGGGTVNVKVAARRRIYDDSVYADAYGLFVNDPAMFPAYQDGELVFVSPTLLPRPGCDVVIETTVGVMVRRLITLDATTATVRRYTPARDDVIALDGVCSLRRILSMNEIMGGRPLKAM